MKKLTTAIVLSMSGLIQQWQLQMTMIVMVITQTINS